MPSPEIHFISLHPIDLNEPKTESVDFSDKRKTVTAYVEELVASILNRDTNRGFRFKSKATEVCVSVNAIATEDDHQDSPQTIANRLLSIEKAVQKRYQQITDILKGSLVQTSLTAGGQKYVLLTKLDHHAFLDEEDFTKRTGLPYEKRVLKGCLIPIESSGNFGEVRVYDTNARIAQYWWSDFLELEEIRSDVANTKLAFNAVDQFLAREVGKKCKGDYNILRNDLVSYFHTRQGFQYTELVETLFGNYSPSVDGIDPTGLKNDAASLPKKNKFDQQFNIESSAVKARYKKIVKLQQNLELHMNAEVPDLGHVVQAYEEDGIKGIKIRTDSGWEQFSRTT